jgi:glycosyltransferase involved in cell wall biosynthesis
MDGRMTDIFGGVFVWRVAGFLLMKINIIHFHLRPGGVRRIIESQVKALFSVCPDAAIKIIAGESPEGFAGGLADAAIYKELDYLSEIPVSETVPMYNRILKILRKEISKSDITHCHNLNLGKNPLLAAAICDLIDEGYKIFLHFHDFAEDRPPILDFSRKILSRIDKAYNFVSYPESENCLFGVLTSCDRDRMLLHGIPANKIHLLPNPVDLGALPEKPADMALSREKIARKFQLQKDKKIFTYPVRAIRRKNIGEMLLLSALFRRDSEWLVTLPPQNPEEIPAFEDWVSFAESKNLPVHFNAGLEMSFNDILSGSDACVTTSVMEGFGMVFLEPWLFGKAVLGRNLPNVTDDLKSQGMIFPRLYDEFRIIYGDGSADFKDMVIDEQKQIIGKVIEDAQTAGSLLRENPFLDEFLAVPNQNIIRNNKTIVRARFSLKSYGEKLYGIYKQMDKNRV